MRAFATRGLIWLHRFEDGLIAFLVLLLVVLAGAQIVLRNFFDSGLPWADPVLRALVLWTGLLGALAAVREDKHICLDVLSRLLTGSGLRVARFLTFGFAAAITGLMAFLSINLVAIELESENNVIAGIPSWALEIILPLAFGLMAVRFALRIWAMPSGPHMPPGIPEDILEHNVNLKA